MSVSLGFPLDDALRGSRCTEWLIADRSIGQDIRQLAQQNLVLFGGSDRNPQMQSRSTGSAAEIANEHAAIAPAPSRPVRRSSTGSLISMKFVSEGYGSTPGNFAQVVGERIAISTIVRSRLPRSVPISSSAAMTATADAAETLWNGGHDLVRRLETNPPGKMP